MLWRVRKLILTAESQPRGRMTSLISLTPCHPFHTQCQPALPSPRSSATYKSAYWQDTAKEEGSEQARRRELACGGLPGPTSCVGGNDYVAIPRTARPNTWLHCAGPNQPSPQPWKNGQSSYSHFTDGETGLRKLRVLPRVPQPARITSGVELRSFTHSCS